MARCHVRFVCRAFAPPMRADQWADGQCNAPKPCAHHQRRFGGHETKHRQDVCGGRLSVLGCRCRQHAGRDQGGDHAPGPWLSHAGRYHHHLSPERGHSRGQYRNPNIHAGRGLHRGRLVQVPGARCGGLQRGWPADSSGLVAFPCGMWRRFGGLLHANLLLDFTTSSRAGFTAPGGSISKNSMACFFDATPT